MLSGSEKAKILLSLLGNNAKTVLGQLAPESATLLTASIEDAPKLNEQEINIFYDEILEKIDSNQFTTLANTASKPETTKPVPTEDESKKQPSSPESNPEAGTEKKEPETPPAPKTRDINEIADLLSKQKPQTVAFFLTKIDEEMKNNLMNYLSDELKSQIETRPVEHLPLSEKVFKNLYETILLKPDVPIEEQPAQPEAERPQ